MTSINVCVYVYVYVCVCVCNASVNTLSQQPVKSSSVFYERLNYLLARCWFLSSLLCRRFPQSERSYSRLFRWKTSTPHSLFFHTFTPTHTHTQLRIYFLSCTLSSCSSSHSLTLSLRFLSLDFLILEKLFLQ